MLSIFNNLSTLQKSLAVSILSIFLFVLSTGVSYSVFSKDGGSSELVTSSKTTTIPGPANQIAEDPSEPKTEECPLNGRMHTKKAKDAWETKRPLAVMIENHQEARPQSGLSTADVVYEAIAEGGITRFMGVFYCNLGDFQVGPVRSARTYFLDWLGEYDALYAHVGGANTPGPADALGQIIKYKVKDLNQFSIGFPTFWRDYQRLGRAVATEHTMYSTTEKLWKIGEKRGWKAKDSLGKSWEDTFVLWKFKEAGKDQDKRGELATAATKIDVNFWSGFTDYSVAWEYDESCSCYKRTNGGSAHMDLNINKQLTTNNVVIQFERESRANDGYENNVHLIYQTTGNGKALVFQDGKAIEGKWMKTSRTTKTKFVDSKGKEISFNRGLIWIQTVPEGAKVTY